MRCRVVDVLISGTCVWCEACLPTPAMAYTRKTTSLLAGLCLATLAGCTGDSGLAPRSPGYLANDTCSANRTAAACAADARGCNWIRAEVSIADVRCGGFDQPDCDVPPGVCVVRDPCLALGEAACRADSGCAWSAVRSLCPVG